MNNYVIVLMLWGGVRLLEEASCMPSMKTCVDRLHINNRMSTNSKKTHDLITIACDRNLANEGGASGK